MISILPCHSVVHMPYNEAHVEYVDWTYFARAGIAES